MASEIKVDTVSEKTSGSGVTIDGLLIKDGGISGDVSLIGTTPTFTIGDAGAEDAALVFDGNAQDYYIALDDSADDLLIGLGSTVGTTPAISIDENLAIKTYGDITMTGTTPVLTIGDAGAEDTAIVFDGNAQDFYIALDDSADDLLIGLGSTVGTTPAISIDENLVTTFSGDVSLSNDTAGNILTLEHTGGSNTGNTYIEWKTGGASSGILGKTSGSDERLELWNKSNDYLSFGSNNTERIRIRNDGIVLVNTVNFDTIFGGNVFQIMGRDDAEVLAIQVENNGQKGIQFGNASGTDVGNIVVAASSTAYNTSSDYRLKENISYTWDATTRLKQLKPARFNWIADDTNTLIDGFVAHEVSSIVPEAVTGTKDELEVYRSYDEIPDGKSLGDTKIDKDGNTIPKHQSIDNSKLIPLLVKTIQELEARVKTIEDA